SAGILAGTWLVVTDTDAGGPRVRLHISGGVSYSFLAVFTSIDKSRSCRADTRDGASVMRHVPLAVFGKAITSRMLGVPHKIAIRRSNPSAIPPCGGAP